MPHSIKKRWCRVSILESNKVLFDITHGMADITQKYFINRQSVQDHGQCAPFNGRQSPFFCIYIKHIIRFFLSSLLLVCNALLQYSQRQLRTNAHEWTGEKAEPITKWLSPTRLLAHIQMWCDGGGGGARVYVRPQSAIINILSYFMGISNYDFTSRVEDVE